MQLVASKDEVARELAQSHFRVEQAVQRIIRLVVDSEREADPQEPIKLLEVNEDTVAAGIQPVYLWPNAVSGVPYPSIIVEVTPAEFEQLAAGVLRLPDGWRLEQEYARAGAVTNGAS